MRTVTAHEVARQLEQLARGDDIEEFAPRVLTIMRGVPWSVFVELDEKPGKFNYMNDRFYMLRRVRNDRKWGRQLFDGFTGRRA